MRWASALRTVKDKKGEIGISFLIAALNGFMVYAAVIGLDVTGDQIGVDATNPAIDDANK